MDIGPPPSVQVRFSHLLQNLTDPCETTLTSGGADSDEQQSTQTRGTIEGDLVPGSLDAHLAYHLDALNFSDLSHSHPVQVVNALLDEEKQENDLPLRHQYSLPFRIAAGNVAASVRGMMHILHVLLADYWSTSPEVIGAPLCWYSKRSI